jgi:hypothetical protein
MQENVTGRVKPASSITPDAATISATGALSFKTAQIA